MTSPTDIPIPPQNPGAAPGPEAAAPAAPAAPGAEQPDGDNGGGLLLRRTLRSPHGDAWEIVGGDEQRIGVVSLQYAGDSAEGVLALPSGTEPDSVRGVLGWVTNVLQLDAAVGPGGLIHWLVTVGEIEEFWRRSPGRPPTGAETDVATARARVEHVLGVMFPTGVGTLEDGTYAVDAGSVRVFVAIRPVENGTVLVRVFSITNLDVPLDGDLPRFLLSLNFTMPIGRFSVDATQRAVWCDHMLAADELDDNTIARTIAAVATTADRYDDEIKGRFGGRTFREEGSPVEVATAVSQPGMAGGYL
ncbi:MAG TPA: YbjN domain-containing protein [Frankiaceae bacterium]|nr:YbjN domain-containing protein [Frankiaceae bacterium]